MPDYKGYDITKLRDNCRFLEVILNRGGSVGGLVGLFFDGATCTFAELPPATDKNAMEGVYKYLQKIRNEQANIKSIHFMIITKVIKRLHIK